MPQNNSLSLAVRLCVMAGYAAVCSLLIGSLWESVFFAVGVVCSLGVLLGDEAFFRRWYADKEAPDFVVTRSPLFLISLIPISILVMMTFGSIWATGLIGGMLLFLLLEMTALRRDPVAFDQRFLKAVKGEVSPQGITRILLFGWAYFFLIHVLVIV